MSKEVVQYEIQVKIRGEWLDLYAVFSRSEAEKIVSELRSPDVRAVEVVLR